MPGPSLSPMRAVQITRFGGPEVLDIVDVPEPTPGPGQQLYDVSTAGLNFADTHQRLS
jgi:NADPH:quinone reductase